ncbi:Domain of uncharacterised function (DUF2825) [Klebsiella pneumoniae]|nr:Domain of uncharacterised function (DUF2825) [Klebsiella pneumoniae]
MRELIGLSPLARGTRLRGSDTRRKAPVYPRWRGEHHYHPHFGIKRCGLSPLARGTLNISSSNRTSIRFIPAGAGNTSLKTTGVKWTTVYPRWRGEHLQPKLNFGFVIGLSPLARGTLLDIPEHCADLRFIPAGAGNTNQAEYSINPTTVYPRWRGEHSSTPARRVRVSGLSPLARGTRNYKTRT